MTIQWVSVNESNMSMISLIKEFRHPVSSTCVFSPYAKWAYDTHHVTACSHWDTNSSIFMLSMMPWRCWLHHLTITQIAAHMLVPCYCYAIHQVIGSYVAGQQQLLCLARTLLKQPKILCLDECTASVDPYTSNAVQQLMHRQLIDSTVIQASI